ncbi:MAG TPA: hypothetical protein VGU71_02470 [Candidatus Dormibacteraeota bacterium]|nr:hypothetical protein [Candidatus Dormibacteraeota bacterium]
MGNHLGTVLTWVLILGLLAGLSLWQSFRGMRGKVPPAFVRQQAIAALCEQRGLLPGPVNLPNNFEIASPLDNSVFENSFSSPDGGISAADYWRHDEKNWYPFSLVAFTIAGLNMPYVAMTRRDMPALPLAWGPQQVGLESIDFNARFMVRAQDRRSAVMLLDEGMMQWLLDCDQVSFEIGGNRVAALVPRRAEPTIRPTPPMLSNPRQPAPVELELLFKFWDGFVPRVPALLRTEYAAPTT